MLRRPRRGMPEPSGLVLVASDPLVIAAAHDAARLLHGARPVQIVSGAEALYRLVGPGDPPRHLVLEGGSAGADLLSAARDPFSGTEVVVVARRGEKAPNGLRSVPAEGAKLAAALSRSGANGTAPASDARSLAAGMARGEITVRLQPIVRLADRRPVMVEALARWERPRSALGAGAFVALAERAGLAAPLAQAVAGSAIEALAMVRRILPLRLSFNVPLSVLLRADLPSRRGALMARRGLRPQDVLLELTESTTVRDTALLRRALQRLDGAGFRVLLDDLSLDDARTPLLGLPFAGVKLDRSLIAALPTERRARAQVERLVRQSHTEGRAVVAEGVTDPLLWRAAAAAGCDLAQGFGVGRPIPPEAMPAWIAAWSGAALPDGR